MEDFERFQKFTTVDLEKIKNAGFNFCYEEMEFKGDFVSQKSQINLFTVATKTETYLDIKKGDRLSHGYIDFDFRILYKTDKNIAVVYPRMIVHEKCRPGSNLIYIKSKEKRMLVDGTDCNVYRDEILNDYSKVIVLSKTDLENLNILISKEDVKVKWHSLTYKLDPKEVLRINEFYKLCSESNVLNQEEIITAKDNILVFTNF